MIATIVHDGALNGAYLMERDRDDLERAADKGGAIIVRFYKWEVPTLSLGFHQSEDRIDFERLQASAVPCVRRPTGGAAVLHSEEITYSIVWPRAYRQDSSAYLQELVGRAITASLNTIGVEATLDSRGEALGPLANRTSCFVRTSRWEVAVSGRKMVGSAQRRFEDAILQHGSILTGPDHLRIAEFMLCSNEDERLLLKQRIAEKSTCASDELGGPVDEESLRAALEENFLILVDQLNEFAGARVHEAVSR